MTTELAGGPATTHVNTRWRQRRRIADDYRAAAALATVSVPTLGYEATAALVKESLRQKRPLRALAVESGPLTEETVAVSLYRSAGVPVPRG